MKAPLYSKMASGHLCIILEDGITYTSFPTRAKKWQDRLTLNLLRKIDGQGERLWECESDGCIYWLAYDDSSAELALEPQDAKAGIAILKIGDRLKLSRFDEIPKDGRP